ncbi:MAG TPA: NAD(P)-binding domain-containing protein [Candidatus Dormibacteraeota bacterium]|nr:NAD(P)-binding domain-containing protein [Candidatus Dormibacteraeota bacterium]
MTETVDVAIIGAGQAGLSTSWYLTQAGIEHVILEAGRVAETWRTRRWDSFCLVTPNWSVMLPGATYDGDDPEGFMPRAELVGHIEGWAAGFRAPVRGNCEVKSLEADDGRFVLQTSAGALRAKRVVVASGGYQKAHLPPGARDVQPDVTQLLAEEYRNPDRLPPGAVLVVGSGQTGCQLAEELHRAGRRVVLACGSAPWAPRRMGGHDLVWWLVESGFANRTIADLPSPAARLISNPLASGHDGGHDLHYRTLHEAGVELVGRFTGASDGKVHFSDVNDIVAGGDFLAGTLKKWFDALCDKRGLPRPWELPPRFDIAAPNELDLRREGIRTVIWTTGFRPNYGWVRFPVFDDMGFPVQAEGRSAVKGLYFMGVHFQRKARSATLYGVKEDAEVLAGHIVEDGK